MRARYCSFALLLAAAPLGAQAAAVQVIGLFPGKAVLVIDGGKPRTVSVGQTTPEGVKLVSADGVSAVIETDGRRQTVALGQHIAAQPASSGRTITMLNADHAGHFHAEGSINNVPVRFLVDTGATLVSMSSGDAARIGISYIKGERGTTFTANGPALAYRIKLDTVRVGDITLHNVDGLVLDGERLPVILLGMSFLNRTEMRREGDSMVLIKRF